MAFNVLLVAREPEHPARVISQAVPERVILRQALLSLVRCPEQGSLLRVSPVTPFFYQR